MVANLYGPVEGKCHNASMLRMSGLMSILQNFPLGPQHEKLCVYGDPAYHLWCQLQAPFREAYLTKK